MIGYPPRAPHEGYPQQAYGHDSYGSHQAQDQHSQYTAPPPQNFPGTGLPSGWIQQWDANSQRYFYVETSTGRTQWDPPYAAPPSHDYGQQTAMYGKSHESAGYGPPAAHGYEMQSSEPHKEKDGHGGLLAKLGALAVGGVGGAAGAHAMSTRILCIHRGCWLIVACRRALLGQWASFARAALFM